MTCSKRFYLKHSLPQLYSLHSLAYMQPVWCQETSLLVIDEATHSGTINVKNTDNHPSLTVHRRGGSARMIKGLKLVTTQPVGTTRAVRLSNCASSCKPANRWTLEHYKRVTFEGIRRRAMNKVKIGINIRQDLPVLIRPAKLAVVTDAWKFLDWTASGTSVTVKTQANMLCVWHRTLVLQPSGISGSLAKPTFLPGKP